MQTVLISGGTGLVGNALTNTLLAKGYKVIILSRKLKENPPDQNLSYALWDTVTQQIDIAAVKQADYIIHLAGAGVVDKKWTAAYKKEIVESRTESSKLILKALNSNSQNNKVKAIISASAIGWYGADTLPVKPFTEQKPADSSFLSQTCKLWEESIEPVTNLGIRLVKFRIGIVLSQKGGALTEFKKPIKLGIAAILCNGKQIVSWIHIDDLCRTFITAIENEKMHGAYNAVAPQPVSNKTLTTVLARTMKGGFFIRLYVPVFVLKLMMGQRSIEVLKSTTVSCAKLLDTGFKFTYSSIEAALINLIKK